MKKTRFILTITALMVGFGVMPVAAQEEQRRELERQLEELRRQMREVESQLREIRGDEGFFRGVVTFSSNRAQLGVFVQTEADPDTDDIGALLQSVTEGGAAEAAGLEDGDIVISFDGERLAGRYPAADPDESEPAAKLIDLIGDKEPGDEVTIEYQRDGQTHSTVVTLTEQDSWFRAYSGPNFEVVRPSRPTLVPPPDVRLFRAPEGRGFTVYSLFGDRWGDMELVSLTEELGRYFGTPEGLLVIKPPEEEEIGLQAGDVILSIDGRDPGTPSRALRIIRSYEEGETINLQVMRDQSRTTVSYVVPEREDTWSRFEGRGQGRERDLELEVPHLELDQIELLEAPHLELEHLMAPDLSHLELETVQLLNAPHLELLTPSLELTVPHLELLTPNLELTVPHLELIHPRRIRRID
jgi:membrane-associated protease RseP (regulator of RpoE activity)